MTLRRSVRSVSISLMGRLLDRVLRGSHAYSVRTDAGGFLLLPRPGRRDEFDAFVTRLMDEPPNEFVAFPASEGDGSFSQVFICPISEDPSGTA